MNRVTKVPKAAEQGMAGIGIRQGRSEAKDKDFAHTLRAAGGVKFSAHAAKRMKLRGVELTDTDRQRLNATVDRMAEKGAKDAFELLPVKRTIKNIKFLWSADSSVDLFMRLNTRCVSLSASRYQDYVAHARSCNNKCMLQSNA